MIVRSNRIGLQHRSTIVSLAAERVAAGDRYQFEPIGGPATRIQVRRCCGSSTGAHHVHYIPSISRSSSSSPSSSFMSQAASSAPVVDVAAASAQIAKAWDSDVLDTLKKYISIPNQSPGFDPEWETNGYQDQAVDLLTNWVLAQNVPGLTLEVLREKGRTPVIFIVVPGSNATSETVLLYGHMDKQPPMTEFWMKGTGPHTPVVKDGKLYGRGGADDGYSIFAAIGALQVLQAQGLPHARSVILVEACEESGSRDLPYFLGLKDKEVGVPSLVCCLDSGCHNYENLWSTTSLRGLMMADLRVDVLSEAVHSGMASGIVPSSFRIMRQLLDRIENAETGKLPAICYAAVPAEDIQYAKAAGDAIGNSIFTKFPWVGTTCAVTKDPAEALMGGTQMPALSYTGMDGLPSTQTAGNVLRSHTTVRLSLRTPPSVEPKDVAAYLEKELTRDAPYGAKITFKCEKAQKGWQAPKLAPWLAKALENASQAFYQKSAMYTGEGGSIPFMGMLGEKYPETQFVITGVLGPSSNAHGPNEFLHIDFTQKLVGAVASILLDHYTARHQKQ